jgi:hypothetical protein
MTKFIFFGFTNFVCVFLTQRNNFKLLHVLNIE